MKEVSIEEKARRYDEALKVLHKYDGANIMFSQSLKEEMFPELKESEDERIRKNLLGYLHTLPNHFSHNGSLVTEWIAWLEKQGEQKPYGQRQECVDCQFNYAGECKGSCVMKRGEHKLVIKVEPKFKVKYANSEYNVLEIKEIAGVTYYGIEDEPNHIDYVLPENCEIISGYGIKENGSLYPTKPAKFSEQNPAWSEEDEEMLNQVIEDIVKLARPYVCYHKDVDWLKSLKERVQTKQEWKQENIGDLTDFEIVMMHIGDSFFGENAGLDPNDTNAIKEQANILLGLVAKQKWNEEDMYNLDNIIWLCDNCMKNIETTWIPSQASKIKSLIERIKENIILQPQSQWKPSDKQMKAIGHICDGNYNVDLDILDSIYRDFKKLREK